MGLEPVRPLLFNQFFKSYTEKVWGVPDHRDPRRLGRPADQGPVVLPRRQVRLLRQQRQQGQEPDRRVQLPALRPRPDVGVDDRGHRGARRQGAAQHQGDQARVRGRAVRARPHRRRDRLRAVGAVISSLPLRNTVGMAEPRPQPRGDRGREGPSLPRLPDRLARARRRRPLPRQLDLHPRARRHGRADPELQLVEPVDGPGPLEACVGLEYFCFEGDELWRSTTTS